MYYMLASFIWNKFEYLEREEKISQDSQESIFRIPIFILFSVKATYFLLPNRTRIFFIWMIKASEWLIAKKSVYSSD